MKTFSVAVAVAVVFTFICIQQSSATLTTLEETMNNPAAEHQETSAITVGLFKCKRMCFCRGTDCRFCCGCCTLGVCGWCCRF
uniref:Hepcidin n=1 Tax=Stegastes partitus TaxID=144197 RepID=A0A3B5AIE9_9TELE